MTRLTFEGRPIDLAPGQSVLDAVHEAGLPLPCSCRNGVCQSCLVRADEGTTPPPGSQRGLKPSLVQRGYFLACVARPTEDLAVVGPGSEAGSIPATIAGVEHLTPTVARVLLLPDPLDSSGTDGYRAGQFLTLIRPDGLARSYSIASIPAPGDPIEIHVRRIEGGQMSCWLYDQLPVGERVELRGPAGDCFYLGEPEEPLLLVGTGTGLAPLMGIARDALARDHTAPIRLYHGALNASGLYLQDELRRMESDNPAFTATLCVLNGEGADATGSLDQIVLERTKELPAQRTYICGDPSFVHSFRKKLFISGARMNAIHADAFETAPPPAQPGPHACA